MLRSWGGIMDMSMDGSPIIDRTPIEGLYLNAGWCYGGFKATPASGWCFAHLLARDRVACGGARVSPGPLRDAAICIDEKGAGRPTQPALSEWRMRIPCPFCGERDVNEFAYLGDAEFTASGPAAPRMPPPSVSTRRSICATTRPARTMSCGITPHGCRSWLRVTRDTLTHEILAACEFADSVMTASSGSRLMKRRTDRSNAAAVRFSSTAERYSGFAGDTLASALLASRRQLVGRSFKYHRPRGMLTAGSEEPNALVELRTGARREPNTRPRLRSCSTGSRRTARTAGHRWPSISARSTRCCRPIFVAGFYYKTFMWPRRSGRSSTSR